ncbi:MAG: hypothetical protein COB84_05925 [Rhodobacteraceae bacterium]|nr:MAG: hypothetical protein COB84_05925 [Paracoccaceae bacterium]
MKTLCTGLLLSVIATQSVALSCMPSNFARTFNTINDAPEIYHIAIGTLKAEKPIPKYQQGKEQHVKTTLTGQYFPVSSTSKTHQLNVTIDTVCFGPWCGGFPKTNAEMLVFLKQTDTGYRLLSTPCDGNFLVSPSAKAKKIITQCIQNKGCSKVHINALEFHPIR